MKMIISYLKSYFPKLRYAIDESPERAHVERVNFTATHGLAREYFRISGWAFHPFHKVTLELRLGKKTLSLFAANQMRSDVKKCYPHTSFSLISGFTHLFPAKILKNCSENQLKIFAHYDGRKPLELWSCSEGWQTTERLTNEREAELLDQYYPARFDSSLLHDKLVEFISKHHRDTPSSQSSLSQEEQGALEKLQREKSVVYVFGGPKKKVGLSGTKTWGLFQENQKNKSQSIHYCYVRGLSGLTLIEDCKDTVSLENLINIRGNMPLDQSIAYCVTDWRMMKDAFLLRSILKKGEAFLFCDNVFEEQVEVKKYQCQDFTRTIQALVQVVTPDPKISRRFEEEYDLHFKPQSVLEVESLLNNPRDIVSATNEQKALSIIVPVYNALESTLKCLRSAESAASFEDEIIVVNDCSNVGTTKALRSFCDRNKLFKLVEREVNGGFIQSCYSGLDVAHPNNDILLLNSDVVVPKNIVNLIKEAVSKNPQIGLASPLSTGSYTLEFGFEGGDSLFDLSSWLYDNRTPTYPTVITPEGQCLYISRDLIRKIGFFDDCYNRGFCEESDLGMRALLSGYDLVCLDNAVVFHEQSASFDKSGRDILIEKNRPLFEDRWGEYYRLSSSTHSNDVFLAEILESYSKTKKVLPKYTLKNHHASDVFQLPESNITQIPIKMESLRTAEIVFILPNVVAGGGCLSVLQHVNEMLMRGKNVKVISLSRTGSFSYPLLTDVIELEAEQVLQLPWSHQNVVATFWSTSYLVQKICQQNVGVRGWYYIQDYEPWFYKENSELMRAAEKTYDFDLTFVAKTTFLKKLVEDLHGKEVRKITPGLARDVFYPGLQSEHNGRPRIAALYRPETPRRGSAELLSLIEKVKEVMPEIEISLYGSTVGIPEKITSAVHLVGKCSQLQVAELYRNSDITLDMSHWHGFGRMGIEAMACGVVPILSHSGGVQEYAVEGRNALMFDPTTPEVAVEHVLNLATDKRLRKTLRTNGLDSLKCFSEKQATEDWLSLFSDNSKSQYVSNVV